MTFTGFQASGKSTVAKAIYYFQTIKEDIIELARTQALNAFAVNDIKNEFEKERGWDLKKGLENHLREKFLRTFGSSWGMSNEMYMEYHFTSTCSVKISLKDNPGYSTPNYIWITYSKELRIFLENQNNCFHATPLGVSEEEVKKFKTELYKLFDDTHSVVYIPAGRSMITLLSQQLGYIYAIMDDVQKRSLDSCTKDYLERILRLKPAFFRRVEWFVVLFWKSYCNIRKKN